MPETPSTQYTRSASPGRWKPGEAKARFGEVVRLAASGRPQRVTVRGENAVVVVAADEFDRLRARRTASSLHDLLSGSPLNRLEPELDSEGVRSPVREVDPCNENDFRRAGVSVLNPWLER